jgi:transcription elongation factor Elf1
VKTANFSVTEIWTVECPYCDREQDATFNADNPMQPMVVVCESCDESFLLTYERD